jgi:hypothetical protein
MDKDEVERDGLSRDRSEYKESLQLRVNPHAQLDAITD